MMNRTFIHISVLACTWALLASSAWARPAHKKTLADYFGPLLAKKLNDCRTCHLPGQPGQEDDKPHNAFGARLAAVKTELGKAGKKTDMISRLDAIAQEDNDGDGVTNLIEILLGHAPGDRQDMPAKNKLADTPKLLQALATRLAEYKCRPFEPVQRPSVPVVKNESWIRNPIDAFVSAEHEKLGLKPRPEAPRHVLMRRLYLDLIGLPPTPEEVAAFVADASPDAYENVVDRLLASPHYGERWGRHWMDVWRYSDWAGYKAEIHNSQPFVWRWRDWIIESLNEDKAYDRMIQEMLAGDELAPADPKTLRATGFLVRNWFKFNRDVWLDRAVEHTSKAFLGVTLNCARCHDHFFDPFSQQEYYQFRAFFEPHDVRVDRVPGQPDTKLDGLVRVFDARPAQPTYLYVRGEDKNPDTKNPLQPGVLSALGGKLVIEPIKLPAEAVAPGKQAWITAEILKDEETAVGKARARLAKAKDGTREKTLALLDVELAEAKQLALTSELALEKLDAPTAVLVKQATDGQRQAALLEARKKVLLGQHAVADAKDAAKTVAQKKLDEVQAALKKLEASPPSTYVKRTLPSYPPTSTGRRLALARWISDKENPLTARVAVNHIWLRHFGKPLVPSVFDFGANGKPPSHPALLDWLAAEFMEKKWSMKKLHRLLVTSSAYRMDSTSDPASISKDGDNVWLWRMNMRRMEAEIVRDSVLAVSGQLDRTFAGPELDHKLGLTTKRRSIYYRYAPEKMMEFMTLFDSANVTECYQRTESVVPQQALAMANNPQVLSEARLLARRIAPKVGDSAFIKSGFEHVLNRAPTAEEESLCREFLTQQAALVANPKGLTPFEGGVAPAVAASADPALRARESLILVLMNHHDFVTIR